MGRLTKKQVNLTYVSAHTYFVRAHAHTPPPDGQIDFIRLKINFQSRDFSETRSSEFFIKICKCAVQDERLVSKKHLLHTQTGSENTYVP